MSPDKFANFRFSQPDIGRALLWQDKDFSLTEARNPIHLIEDSEALGHCLGTLKESPVQRGSVEPGLHYWQKIMCGKSRIFTLMHQGKPQYTIEYDVRKRRILQIQGRSQNIQAGDYGFNALCSSLLAMTKALYIYEISGLPTPNPGMAWSASGEMVAGRCAELDTIVAGTMVVEVGDGEEGLLRSLSTHRLTVDISAIQSDFPLPKRIASSVIAYGDDFILPSVAFIRGDLEMHCNSVSASSLKEIGGTLRSRCKSAFEYPSLRNIGRDAVLACDDRSNLDALEYVQGSVYIGGGQPVEVPSLKFVGGDLSSIQTSGVFPKLIEIRGTARFTEIEVADFPMLRLIGKQAWFPNLIKGHFPKLPDIVHSKDQLHSRFGIHKVPSSNTSLKIVGQDGAGNIDGSVTNDRSIWMQSSPTVEK